jgi:hypothetical protein
MISITRGSYKKAQGVLMKRRGFLKSLGGVLGALTVGSRLDAKESVPPLQKVTVKPPDDDMAIRKMRERWAHEHREDMAVIKSHFTTQGRQGVGLLNTGVDTKGVQND